jgi:hypothetical protein
MFPEDEGGGHRTARIVRWYRTNVVVWVLSSSEAQYNSTFPLTVEKLKRQFKLAGISVTVCDLGVEWLKGANQCAHSEPQILYLLVHSQDDLRAAWHFLGKQKTIRTDISQQTLLHYQEQTIGALQSGLYCYASVFHLGDAVEIKGAVPEITSAVLVNTSPTADPADVCAEVLSRRALGLIGPAPEGDDEMVRRAFFAKEAVIFMYSSAVPAGATLEQMRQYMVHAYSVGKP